MGGAERSAVLDGVWDFYPGEHTLAQLESLRPEPIRVPGLWEAQGHLDLDGEAWYRRTFAVGDASGWWSLCFGAVMDIAEVFLNGRLVARHELPFTPFEADVTGVLAAGENVLAVRVVDPPVDDPEHLRVAHGKQGWGNHVFPSRPSLYLTYGGIWQSVTLRSHGPVVVRDVFVDGDPDDLVVRADVVNRAGERVAARVGFRAVGLADERELELGPGERRTLEARLGPTSADRWRPEAPALHEALVDATVDGRASDGARVRFGLRTIRVEGDRILIGGEPYRMRSALVQGFTADGLYAEGSRAEIEAEVSAAKEMGFNTLRLHIKAFDPVYLDVCDELGMLLHCDIPVAEPLAYEELDEGTPLAERCVAAAREQVRRDRNHPSVVLWTAMNEIGDRRREIRGWSGYERFARALVAAIEDEDPTRPVIENDWVEPDPEHVFASPILTAHWYGRLHADYLATIEAKSAEWSGTGRPFFVSEYGDWGLPEMPELPEPPFWDTRELYAAGLVQTQWPGTIEAFVRETQRYQGLSDRLQTEVFRRHDGIGGYCLTELTDVPHELNGLLDLHRRPKAPAVAEMARANQVVLPMLALESLVHVAGGRVQAALHVANDGPPLAGVELELRFGDEAAPGSPLAVAVGALAGYSPTGLGAVELRAPEAPGSHDLVLLLRADGRTVARNRYPIHVVEAPAAPEPVRLLGGGATADALRAVGARSGDEGPTVVAEGALDGTTGRELGRRLARGETALVLAQTTEAAPHFPCELELLPVATMWGSSVFHFTTDASPLSSLPRGNVLVAEDSTVQALNVVASIEGERFPACPVVIAYKPDPNALTGSVIGAHPVGPGRLVYCQYRLAERATAGDAAAGALLADLVLWVARAR